MPKLLFASALVFGAAMSAHADTLADWTFETSVPTTSGPVLPEILGPMITGTASAFHAGTSTYSNPAGNGSSHSYSSTNWAVGDYYQFTLSTTGPGFQNLMMTWDQISSSTGPGSFGLLYSTDGTNFTEFGSNYTVFVNGGSTTWSTNPASHITASTYSVDLSSITAFNNASQVYFRIQDEATTSAGGATTASGGTDRVDNVVFSTVPEPSTFAAAILGCGLLLVVRRKRALLAK